jgi:hypothetical protein
MIGTKVPGEDIVYFPPRTYCPVTKKLATEQVVLSGFGKIVAFSITHVPPERHELNHPYVIAIVELNEGPRVTSEIVGVDVNEVKLGMTVKAAFRKYGADTSDSVIVYGYKFTPNFVKMQR